MMIILEIAAGIVLAVFILGFLSHALYSKTFWFAVTGLLIAALAAIGQLVVASVLALGLIAAAGYHLRSRRALLSHKRARQV